MIVTYKDKMILKIGQKGPTLKYNSVIYKPDPAATVKVTIEKGKEVEFMNLGDYGEAQIIADHGTVKGAKEVVNENINRKPAEG